METTYGFNEGEKLSSDIRVIAKLESVYEEKFGIPRQPGLIPEAQGVIRFEASEENKQAFYGLEDFSHIWLITWFHQVSPSSVKPRVRPPRLGGEKSLGVYATRSPFRPNPIALSLVEMEKLQVDQGKLEIWVRGVDLVSGTPILDIKPYLPYCEALPEAKMAWVEKDWEELSLFWSAEAQKELASLKLKGTTLSLIEKAIRQDPRPAYKKEKETSRAYGVKLAGHNVRFQVEQGKALILSIEKA